MKLMIYYPGGVAQAIVSDDATDQEIAEVVKLASTIEEGNGDGRIRMRKRGDIYDHSRDESDYKRRLSR